MKLYRWLLIIFCCALTTVICAKTNLELVANGIDDRNADKNVQFVLKEIQGSALIPSSFAIQQLVKRTRKAIRSAMAPFGYYRVKIKVQQQKVGKHLKLQFNVTPGAKIKIAHLDIKITGDGKNFKEFQKVIKNLPLKVGDALDTQKYEEIKHQLSNTAQRFGFFKAQILQSKVVINYITYHASILINFATGPRYRFGTTTFSQVPLANSFLRRFLRYHQGEYYDDELIQKTEHDLGNSPYFQQALVTPQPSKAKGLAVPMQVHLVTGKARHYMFGIGYGTGNNTNTNNSNPGGGVRGTIGLTFNRVNRYGHRLDFLGQASYNNNRFVANYYIPGPRPTRDLFTLSAGIGNISQVNANSKVRKISALYTMRFTHWEINAALNYLNEKYNYLNLFNGPFQNDAQYIFPSLQIHNFHGKGELHPKYGYSVSMSIAGAPEEKMFASEGFFQVRLDGKALATLTPTHTRFVFRGSFGRTFINSIQNLPLSLQLFTGGATTLRGYSYNSIGPGRNLVLGSAEIQQRVYKQWYIAGFCDAGNVTNGDPFDNLNVGVGPGLVWLSPIGTIGVYWAVAVTLPKRPWQIQFSIGPDL